MSFLDSLPHEVKLYQWLRRRLPPAAKHRKLDSCLAPLRCCGTSRPHKHGPPVGGLFGFKFHFLTRGLHLWRGMLRRRSQPVGIARGYCSVPRSTAADRARDGNELAGIRLPNVAVPLATYTGWNFRSPSIGQPDELTAGADNSTIRLVAVNYQLPPYSVFSINPGANI